MLVNPGLRRFLSGGARALLRRSTLYAALQTSLSLTRGTSSPTFTRADATECATVTDFEGVIRTVPANCARFQGARMVRNLAVSPENLVNAAWNPSADATRLTHGVTFTLATGYCYQTIYAGVGTGTYTISAMFSGTPGATTNFGLSDAPNTFGAGQQITLTATPTHYELTYAFVAKTGAYFQFGPSAIAALGLSAGTASCTVTVTDIQIEKVDGQSDTRAASYVSVGVLSAPYHGAGVDGIKFFDTMLDGTAINSGNAKFAVLPGVAASRFTAPSQAAYNTQTLGIAVKVAPTNWAGAYQTLLAKWAALPNSSYGLWTDSGTGKLTFIWSPNGAASSSAISTLVVPFANNTVGWVGVTFTAATGTATFYTSSDGITWTQLGTPVVSGATTINSTTTSIEVGSSNVGAAWPLTGSVYRAKLFNTATLTGTPILDFNPNDAVSGGSFTSSATGETWTINGSASVYGTPANPAQWNATGPLGYLSEGSRQNILLNSLLDGTNLSTQAITVTAAPWTVSFTGTGTITFTGAYVGSLVGSGASTRVEKTFTPSAGALTCTVSGTVKWAQAELGSSASTYIPTGASAVTKTLEVDSYPTASNITAATGSIYLEFTPNHAPSGTIALWGTYVDASNYTAILHDATNIIFRKRIAGVNYDSTLALAFVSGTTYKIAASWSASNSYIAASGTAGAGSGNGTAAQIAATMQVGADGNGGQQPFAEIRNNYAWLTALTSAQLASITGA